MIPTTYSRFTHFERLNSFRSLRAEVLLLCQALRLCFFLLRSLLKSVRAFFTLHGFLFSIFYWQSAVSTGHSHGLQDEMSEEARGGEVPVKCVQKLDASRNWLRSGMFCVDMSVAFWVICMVAHDCVFGSDVHGNNHIFRLPVGPETNY